MTTRRSVPVGGAAPRVKARFKTATTGPRNNPKQGRADIADLLVGMLVLMALLGVATLLLHGAARRGSRSIGALIAVAVLIVLIIGFIAILIGATLRLLN